MSEERGFEVVDKRGGGAPGAPGSGEPAGVEGVSEQELQEALHANPLLNLDVHAILQMTVGILNERAWISLGLVPHPASGQIQQDLAEARRAIDAITDLARHLEAGADAEEKRELQTLVSNLKLNFVRQSSGGG